MTAGQILISIAIVCVGVVSMAFQNKCFTPMCLMSYICLWGGVLAVYSFIESLMEAVMPKKQAPGVPTGLRGSETGEASVLAPSPQALVVGRINASILANPFITDILQRDYYGLGQRKGMEPAAMLTRMERFGTGGGVLVLVLSIIYGISLNPGLIALGFLAGFLLPHFIARSEISKRQGAALMSLPSFVDLLALTIESGLDYLNSMDKILATMFKKKGPLEDEIENVLKEVNLGYPRRDALRHWARRVDVQEVRSLVGLLIQSDELGTGLVLLLRNFSQDMRIRRVAKAETLAGKASTKMLGPMMIFIFPVIFALILSPFAVTLMKGGGVSF